MCVDSEADFNAAKLKFLLFLSSFGWNKLTRGWQKRCEARLKGGHKKSTFSGDLTNRQYQRVN